MKSDKQVVYEYDCPSCEEKFWIGTSEEDYIPRCPKCGAEVVLDSGINMVDKRQELIKDYIITFYNLKVFTDHTCPSCEDGELVPKINKRDDQRFWGCTNYPECKFTSRLSPREMEHLTMRKIDKFVERQKENHLFREVKVPF